MNELLKAIIKRVSLSEDVVSRYFVEASELLRRFDGDRGNTIDSVGCLLDEIARLRKVAAEARAILKAAPELNMANYTPDDVAALNAAACEAYCVLEGTEGKP